jgi:hypothetical protein
MKPTINLLVDDLNSVQESEVQNVAEKVLDEHLRPQPTDLANWSVVGTKRIQCTPVLLDRFPDIRYRFLVYQAAAGKLCNELSRHSEDWSGMLGYYSHHDSFLFFIDRYKSSVHSEAEQEESARLTIQTIFESVWKRAGFTFLQAVWHERGRLCDFLMDPGNWTNRGAVYSRRFKWSEALVQSRDPTQQDVMDQVAKQLETEAFIIKFDNDGQSCGAAVLDRPPPKSKNKKRKRNAQE